jgi:hypothetical protein
MSTRPIRVIKNASLITLFLLVATTTLRAQEPRVHVSSPIDAVTYVRSDQNEVFVTVKLREAKSNDAFALISRFRITAFNITSDDGRSGLVNNTAMPAESLEYNFVIPISMPPRVSAGSLFRLAPNWKTFTISCEYEFTPDGSSASKRLNSASFTVRRNFIEPEATRNVRSTIGLPVLTNPNIVAIPIKLDDDDLVLEVELRDANENLLASGSNFVERGEEKVVKLKHNPLFAIALGQALQVRIKPRFRNEVNLSTKTREWIPEIVRPSYTIVRASSSDLNDLKVVSVTDPIAIKIQTTGGGSLSMLIEGVSEELRASSNEQGIHEFSIPVSTLKGLPEGSTNFRFKGTSTLGVELAQSVQSFKMHKDTRTRLLGVTGIKLDTSGGGNVLQIDYQLSRKVNSHVQIDNVVLLPAKYSGPETGSGAFTYTARIDIKAASTLNALNNALARSGSTTTQVKFGITETKDLDIVEIGGFKLDAFAAPVISQPKDKDTLLRLVNEAAQLVKNNQSDQALVKIRTALGFDGAATPAANEQQAISQVITQLRQDNGQTGKSKALAIIGSIGRVALNLFGIPVPPRI